MKEIENLESGAEKEKLSLFQSLLVLKECPLIGGVSFLYFSIFTAFFVKLYTSNVKIRSVCYATGEGGPHVLCCKTCIHHSLIN